MNKEFENKICASYEKQVQNLRNQIHELEGIVNKTNPIMNVIARLYLLLIHRK